jgi:hypothetical protein
MTTEPCRPTRSRSPAVARVLTVALAFAGLSWGQASSTISLDNGLSFSISATLGTPAETERLNVEMFRASGDSFYRVFKDQSGLAVFAYELELARASGENEFRVTARPAGDGFASRFPGADGGKPVPTLSADREFVIHVSSGTGSGGAAGNSAEIGLFTLEGQGLKVIDVARVTAIEAGAPGAAQSGQQTPLLRLSGLRVSINGAPDITGFGGQVVGKFALIYIPGQGAYYFSVTAMDKLTKAGSIDHHRMSFTVDNEAFECVADKDILARANSGESREESAEVWVYHDPAYAPAGNWTALAGPSASRGADRPFAAAADSLQWWMR